jgi:hypothetical protein
MDDCVKQDMRDEIRLLEENGTRHAAPTPNELGQGQEDVTCTILFASGCSVTQFKPHT